LGATPPVTAPSENSRLVVVVADTFRVSPGGTSVAVYDNASLDTEAILLYAILHEKLKICNAGSRRVDAGGTTAFALGLYLTGS
jgi:hypothetical protein